MVEDRLQVLPAGPTTPSPGCRWVGTAPCFAAQLPGYFGSAATFSGVLSTQRPEWPTGFDPRAGAGVYGDPQAQAFYSTGHNPTALIANLRTHGFSSGSANGACALPPATTDQRRRCHRRGRAVAARGGLRGVRPRGGSRRHLPGGDRCPRLAVVAGRAASALQWGFFRTVAERPARGATGRWPRAGRPGTRRSGSAPRRRRSHVHPHGYVLSAGGSGTVTISAAGRPGFTETLPFARRLVGAPGASRRAAACRGRSGHVAHGRRGRAASRAAAKRRAPARGSHRRAHRRRPAGCRSGG